MDGHIGISLGAIGTITVILSAAMAGLGAPWWVAAEPGPKPSLSYVCDAARQIHQTGQLCIAQHL